MTGHDELAARARAVIDANRYMTLGTVDPEGQPWVTPVYFAPDRYRDFYWISVPTAKHSRNVEECPTVSIVIFDSQVPIGGAEAVYLRARAVLVPDDELARCAELFCSRDPEQIRYGPADLTPPSEFRLYRATAYEHSVLVRGSDPAYGRGADARVTVDLVADSHPGV